MATLATRNFTTLIQNQAAAIQSKCNTLLDFTIGSILRAMIESNGSVVLWLQGLILYVLSITRASTSTGVDLDSWVNDFGVTRLAATPASGAVLFSRFTNSQGALIPVGAQVQTADSSASFSVVVDATNSSYSASRNGYVLPAGVSSLSVPVKANIPAAGGNVVVGAITQINTSIPYVDTVTNVAQFTNGADAETDAALRTRFLAFIASLSKATKTAITYAVLSLQLGMEMTLTENYDYTGVYTPGFFYLVVDDGSGAPPSTLLDTVYAAVDAVRAVGVRFAVFAPVALTANVSMSIVTAQGYDHPTVVGQVGQAITTYINTLPVGVSLPYTRLAQVAYGSSPGVSNVNAVTLNSGTADLTATAKNVIKLGTLSVS